MVSFKYLIILATVSCVLADGDHEDGGAEGEVITKDSTGERYTKYNKFDVKSLGDNLILLKAYSACFLNEGPCTNEAKDFRRVLRYAVKKTCVKCSENQKELVRVLSRSIKEKLPEQWTKLVKKYDPDNLFLESFLLFIEEKPTVIAEPQTTEKVVVDKEKVTEADIPKEEVTVVEEAPNNNKCTTQ